MATGTMKTMTTAPHASVSQFLSLDRTSTSATIWARETYYSNKSSVKLKGLGFQTDEAECKFRGLGFRISCNSSLSIAKASFRASDFAEPSVTAKEIAKYEKQLTEQEAITSYLQTLGIDTTDLDDVQLPASLAIVRERVAFLLKIGLTVDDINDYPPMVGYSIKRNLIPVLTYLESLGVTSTSLPILVRNYPQVLRSSVAIDLHPHVEYLEGLGVQRADIGSVLTRYPDIFGFKIEGTISTSTSYLVMLGVNPRRMGSILTEMPQILGMHVGNNIKRKVDFLRSFGLSQAAIAKMIEMRPCILGLGLAEQMRPIVDSLVELGVARDAISHVITQFPDILRLDVNRKLTERLTWLTSDVGILPHDIGALIAKLPQILVLNTTKASARVEFLKQAGFAAEDVASMVRSYPQLLAASIDKNLKPNVEYLVSKMGRNLAEVVDFPAFLLYNVDTIVQPRHEQIQKNEIQCSLPWMLNCDDAVFQQRLHAEYAEETTPEAEPDVSYIVTRRVRLTDDETEAQTLPHLNVGGDVAAENRESFTAAGQLETEEAEESHLSNGIVTTRRRMDNAVEDPLDDAQARSFQ